MKKILLFLCLLPHFAFSTHPGSQDHLIELNHSVVHVLLEVLDTTQESLNYWEVSYFKSPHADTLDKINYLKQKLSHYCYYIGKLRNLHYNLLKKKNPLFLHKLATCISECTGKQIEVERLSPNIEMVDITKNLLRFRKQELNELSHARKPSHLKNNWQKYVLGTSASLLLGYLVFNYSNEILTTTQSIRSQVGNFIHKNIIQPVGEFLGFVYNEERGITQEIIDAHREANLENRIRFLKEFGKEQLNPAEIANNELEFQKILSADYTEQTQFTRWNILLGGSLRRNLTLKWADVEEVFHFIVDYLESARSGVKVLLLGAAIELSALHGYLAYKASISLYKWARGDHKKPIQHILHSIYSQLNINPDSIDEEYRQSGMMHYWLQRLKTYTSTLPHADRGSFLHDIELLDSPKTNTDSKARTIEQMYRRYPSLQKLKL